MALKISTLAYAGKTLGIVASFLMALGAHAQSVTPLYSFTGAADGDNPMGGVVADSAGTIYGETFAGGTTQCTSRYQPPKYGCGTVYSYNATTGLKVLVTFTGSNGAHGSQTLALIGSTLYGTTYAGGASDAGTIFSVKTDGTGFKLLHQFSGADGEYPSSPLVRSADGAIYGTTTKGGDTNNGVLFSITPQGTYALLHQFAGGADGVQPESLVSSPTGTLYGNTVFGGQGFNACGGRGCGIFFSYTPATKSFATVYEPSQGFTGIIGSTGPGASLNLNNGDYIQSLDRSGLANLAEIVPSVSGSVYSGPLLMPNGSLIGVMGAGPISPGTLYSVANGTLTILAIIGTNPQAQPIVLPGGEIAGTASQGGLCSGCGYIWQYP